MALLKQHTVMLVGRCLITAAKDIDVTRNFIGISTEWAENVTFYIYGSSYSVHIPARSLSPAMGFAWVNAGRINDFIVLWQRLDVPIRHSYRLLWYATMSNGIAVAFVGHWGDLQASHKVPMSEIFCTHIPLPIASAPWPQLGFT